MSGYSASAATIGAIFTKFGRVPITWRKVVRPDVGAVECSPPASPGTSTSGRPVWVKALVVLVMFGRFITEGEVSGRWPEPTSRSSAAQGAQHDERLGLSANCHRLVRDDIE